MLKSNLIAAAFILGILLLTVEGYYVYRFYEVNYSPDSSQSSLSEPSDTGPETTASSDNSSVHRAEQYNISDNSTYLDIPAANGNPDARISITQNWNPGGGSGTYNDHPVGVWYDASREQWAIFNQDRAAMSVGTSFNVTVSGGSGGS